MERLEQIKNLNRMLIADMPGYAAEAESFADNIPMQRRLLRSLMNLRPPRPLPEGYEALQDSLLSAEREEKGVMDIALIPEVEPNIRLWQGDITRLNAEAAGK